MHSNEFDTVSLGITHQFTPQIRSRLRLWLCEAKDDNRFEPNYSVLVPPKTNSSLARLVNALITRISRLLLGIEYVYGERETFDNRNGDY
ncbi:DcaP family trimeric outer membrane transporter [Acinetobacter baumannii]